MERERAKCEEHGDEVWATFVCRHLAEGSAEQMLTDEPVTEDAPWPDAFCERCDAYRFDRGAEEWDDDDLEFADVTVLCHHCYEERRTELSAV